MKTVYSDIRDLSQMHMCGLWSWTHGYWNPSLTFPEGVALGVWCVLAEPQSCPLQNRHDNLLTRWCERLSLGLLLSRCLSCSPLPSSSTELNSERQRYLRPWDPPRSTVRKDQLCSEGATWSEKCLLRCFCVIDKITYGWCWNNQKVIRDIPFLVPTRCCRNC